MTPPRGRPRADRAPVRYRGVVAPFVDETAGSGEMTSVASGRITQRQIAALAGVSQAAVSLVLNGRTDTTSRIPQETRDRVLEVIRQTGYAADPAARRLAGKSNNLIGVFTYEQAFPRESSDFYAPLLTGIEVAAEALGMDLLVFTSARAENGRRLLFHENSRLRLADGCVLLGREMDPGELARLAASGYPFVAVGRRDGDHRIPYVGADYPSAADQLARRALALGHRRFLYLRLDTEAESTRDRLDGFLGATDDAGIVPRVVATDMLDTVAAWRLVREGDETVVFVEDPAQAQAIADAATADGVAIPRDLSLVALGERFKSSTQEPDFTRLVAPRSDLAQRAVEVLAEMMDTREGELRAVTRLLLDCVVVEGATLGPPRSGRRLAGAPT